MTNIEAIALGLYLVAMAAAYGWVATARQREVLRQCEETQSRKILSAGSGTMLVPLLDPYVGAGSVLFVPSGDGNYLTRNRKHVNERYKNALIRWLERGAVIHIIITWLDGRDDTPWRELKTRFPEKLHVHFLDRTRVSGPQAGQTRDAIKRLDTYHAVVLLNARDTDGYPGAMWLEANHPLTSKFAFGIEFVAPADAAHDERLERYATFYRDILIGSHASELSVDDHDTGSTEALAA